MIKRYIACLYGWLVYGGAFPLFRTIFWTGVLFFGTLGLGVLFGLAIAWSVE